MLMASGLLCALSGFRNSVFRFGLSLLAGLFATVRWKAFLVFPLGLIALAGVAFTQGRGLNYPIAMQRALSFFPGDWDAKAKQEAGDSSKWREKITTLFYAEYFAKHPLLGAGYHFDPALAKEATDIYLSVARVQASAGDPFKDVRNFIEMRQPHEGPVHILLVTGVVGMVFFVGYCLALLLYSFASVLRVSPRRVTPIQIWSVALILPNILGFFIVFGDYTSFFVTVVPIATLLYRFERLKVAGLAGAESTPVTEVSGEAQESFWQGSQPDWHPRQPPVS